VQKPEPDSGVVLDASGLDGRHLQKRPAACRDEEQSIGERRAIHSTGAITFVSVMVTGFLGVRNIPLFE